MAFDLSDLQKEMVHMCVYFQATYGQFSFVLIMFSGMLLRQTRNSAIAKLIILQSCSQLARFIAVPRISRNNVFFFSLGHPNPLFILRRNRVPFLFA